MENRKVVLIGSSHYHGLNLARAFGEKGIRPYGIVVGEHSNRFLEASKYWEQIWNVESEEKALHLLKKRFSSESGRVLVLPWSDGAAAALDNDYDSLRDRFLIPSIREKQGELFYWMDKDRQMELAEKLELPVSPALTIKVPLEAADRQTLQETLSLPYIVKPVASFEGKKADIRKIGSISELEEYLYVLEQKGYSRILVQEYLNIHRELDFMGMCSRSGSCYTVLEKIRNWPTEGGSTSFGKVIDPKENRAFFEDIIRKLVEFGYCGPFDIDIFEVDGRLYFNEINWRSSANVFAAVGSGNNYPYEWYCSADQEDQNKREIRTYQGPDLYFMNEITDSRHVLHREIPAVQWLRDMKRCSGYAFRNRKDPRPLFVRLGGPVTTMTAKLRRKQKQSGMPDITQEIRPSAGAGEIRVIPKPESVSYDEIADVLHDAHRANTKAGMHFTAAEQSGDEIREHLGDDGQFYVIMDEAGLCAVGAVRYRTWNKWFCRGELCGDILFVGVRERCKGQGLSKLLFRELEQEAFTRCSIATMNTARQNERMLKSRRHDGWRYVDYFSHDGTDFYSIMLAKWRDGCPWTESKCRLKYLMRKAIVIAEKKKNGSYRTIVKILRRK